MYICYNILKEDRVRP